MTTRRMPILFNRYSPVSPTYLREQQCDSLVLRRVPLSTDSSYGRLAETAWNKGVTLDTVASHLQGDCFDMDECPMENGLLTI